MLTTEITRIFQVSLIEVLLPKNLFVQILDTFLWFSNRNLRLNFFQNEQFFKDRLFTTLSPKISCLYTRGSRSKLEKFFFGNLITKNVHAQAKSPNLIFNLNLTIIHLFFSLKVYSERIIKAFLSLKTQKKIFAGNTNFTNYPYFFITLFIKF